MENCSPFSSRLHCRPALSSSLTRTLVYFNLRSSVCYRFCDTVTSKIHTELSQFFSAWRSKIEAKYVCETDQRMSIVQNIWNLRARDFLRQRFRIILSFGLQRQHRCLRPTRWIGEILAVQIFRTLQRRWEHVFFYRVIVDSIWIGIFVVKNLDDIFTKFGSGPVTLLLGSLREEGDILPFIRTQGGQNKFLLEPNNRWGV